MGNSKWNELIITSQELEKDEDDASTKVKSEEALEYANSPSSPINVNDEVIQQHQHQQQQHQHQQHQQQSQHQQQQQLQQQHQQQQFVGGVGEDEKKDANLTPLQSDFQKHDTDFFPPVYNKSSKIKSEKSYKYNPKPLGKKNNRSFVPEERKTEDYWHKRIKNNVAARKSREDRRKKELEILDRKSQFEKENVQLRLFIEKVQSENQYLLYEINMLRNETNMLRGNTDNNMLRGNEGRNFPKYEL